MQAQTQEVSAEKANTAPSKVGDPSSNEWTHEKPTTPGAYYMRGYRIGEDDYPPALVEVDYGRQGQLVCNIHEINSNDDRWQWFELANLADRFEWLGPLSKIGGRHD